MPALRELQAAFRRALLEGDDAAAAQWIAGDGISPSARLAIYRHHVFATLTAVLEDAYPVVRRLVDPRFFRYAADQYIRTEPPAGPCLFEYGETFARFLAGFPPCRSLPYLPDVARLEWAMHRALHAPDARAIEPAALAAVPPEDVARLVLTFESSVAHLASPWPIDRIWRTNQDGSLDQPVDLGEGGAAIEIRRVDGAVTMRRLDAAEHALRAAIGAGAMLGVAAEAALALNPALDLATSLARLLDEQLVVGFTVSPP